VAAQRDGTWVSLLGRLRRDPADPAAWGDFVDHYGPKIVAWCRRWRLQDADAQDVTQTVLLRLAAQMRSFAYDPSKSFRAWLKTVAHNAWRDVVLGQQRPGRGSGDSQVLALLAEVKAREDLMQRLEEEFDRELLQEAMARVRLRVEPRTWQAFHLAAVEGLSGAAVASRTGMKVATVFVARSKVQHMIKEEVQRLEQSPPGA